MHFFHINDIYLNNLFDTFKSLWIHISLHANFFQAGSFCFISSSIPFGVFLALAWNSILQNPWYLISFAIKSMFDIFRSISCSSNQLTHFLIFTFKYFFQPVLLLHIFLDCFSYFSIKYACFKNYPYSIGFI